MRSDNKRQGIKDHEQKTLGEKDGEINERINGTHFSSRGESEHTGGSCEVTHTQKTANNGHYVFLEPHANTYRHDFSHAE